MTNQVERLTNEEIVEIVGKGEPLDYATMHFSDPKVRWNYRIFETMALNHIANRECIFCFKKSNEEGMGGLNELERIGYCHSECIDAFYEAGFKRFNLIGFNKTINDYSWEMSEEW